VHFSDIPYKKENVCIGTHLNIFFASSMSKVVGHKSMTCINGLIFCTQRLKILWLKLHISLTFLNAKCANSDIIFLPEL